MLIFLPFFGEKVVFVVEENKGVLIFLPFFGKKAVFGVEENRGVAIFLYNVRITPDRQAKTQAVLACGQRLE